MSLPFWKVQSVGNDFPLIHLEDLVPKAELVTPSVIPDVTLVEFDGNIAQLHELVRREPDAVKRASLEKHAADFEARRDRYVAILGSGLSSEETVPPPSLDFRLAELAVRMADRRFGIGGDGILAVAMEGEALRLRMFNPDGTEDFCGNGLRCAALHAHALGWVGEKMTIRHLDEEVPTEILGAGMIRTLLPPASYEPERVPLIGRRIFNETVWSGMDSGMPLSLFGSALTTGSTHVIILTAELPDDDTFFAISPKIEHDPQFPQRTSVIWSREVAPMRIRIRIWERGAGETLGCGTGSSAAAVDYLRRKSAGGTVIVENPGGEVSVTLDSWESPITVEAVAETVYEGVFEPTAELP
jgi:diaminopimelate epimerase